MSTRHLLLPLVLGLPLCLTAQEGNAPGGQYYIHGIYNPTIADVRKIDQRPTLLDTVVPERTITYSVQPVQARLPVKVDSIAPAKLSVSQANERLYKGFVKLGFGLYNTPLGELYYDQGRSKKDAYGIHLKHFSSAGGLQDVGPSDYSFNSVDAFYTRMLRHHAIQIRGDYARRGVGYYGFRTEGFDTLGLEVPNPRQVYNDLGFTARVRSLYADSAALAHDVRLDARYYTNKTGSRETNIRFVAEAGKQVGSETYAGQLLIDNNAYTGLASDTVPSFRQNGTMVTLTPSVSTRGERYVVRVGAGITVDALSKTSFHVFPQAYLSYSLFDDILVPYIGVDGQRRRNSLRSITQENPWTEPAPGLANSSLLYDLYGGLRGSLSSTLGFDVRVSYSGWKDRLLYVTEAFNSFGNQFAPVYDDMQVLDVSGDISYDAGRGIRAHARLDIYNYTMGDQAEPWNLPPYQLTLGGQYSLREKLIVKLDAVLMGKRKAFSPVWSSVQDPSPDRTEVVELNGFVDLHLGAEYRYTKRLSVFLQASNLSASRYERWYRYPVQRTLLIGGASYAF